MTDRIPNYYIAWFLVIIAALLMHNLVNSRAGRALRSIHGNEDAAEAMGIDTARYKLHLFRDQRGVGLDRRNLPHPFLTAASAHPRHPS